MTANLISFAAVAFVLVASPGPDTILILRNTLSFGRAAGYLTVVGVQIGIIAHALLAIIGLSALLYYSENLFRLLVVAGTLYLAWLGWLIMRQRDILAGGGGDAPAKTRAPMLVQGMLCNLLNPKVIVLFIALFPVFVDAGAGVSRGAQMAALTAVLLAINIPFQAAVVVVARAFGALLRRPRLTRVIQSLLGGALMVFAALLFFNHIIARTA